LSLPSNFKEALGNRKVDRLVAVNYESYLRVWPEDEWEIKEQELSRLNVEDKKVSDYLGHLYSNLTELEIDSQGRFFLPESWRKELGFSEQVYLLGKGNHFEIWKPEEFNFKSRELKTEFSANRDYVVGLLEKRSRDEGN